MSLRAFTKELSSTAMKFGIGNSQDLIRMLINPRQIRYLSTKQLSPTITFLTNSNSPIKSKIGRPGQWEYESNGRHLSILLCWLMAKNNAVKKYTDFYLEKGFDVLTVRITPTQLLLPTKTNWIVENELMPILHQSNHAKSLIHGFSVGGYVFAQMLRIADEQQQYKNVIDRMVAQIWDSVVDVEGTAIGVSKSVFPKNRIGQKLLMDYINFHMKMMYNVSTKHYNVAHEYFYNKPLRSPSLFLNSERDPISPMNVIKRLQDVWTSNGMTVQTKAWPNTTHVGHMRRHPDEYKHVVTKFLGDCGLRGKRVEASTATNTVFNPIYNPVVG